MRAFSIHRQIAGESTTAAIQNRLVLQEGRLAGGADALNSRLVAGKTTGFIEPEG